MITSQKHIILKSGKVWINYMDEIVKTIYEMNKPLERKLEAGKSELKKK